SASLPPSALPTCPPVWPACSQKIRSASLSPPALGSPPASRSPHPAAPTTSPTTLPTPPAMSYTRWFPALRSAPSALPSVPHPPQIPLPTGNGPAAPAALGPQATPVAPLSQPDSLSSTPPASAAPHLPSTFSATPHNPHTAPPIRATGPLPL